MSGKYFHQKALAALSLLRSIRSNIEGVAAVEFGFIAPIMLLMLVGTAEVSRAVTADRRFGLATSMIADLVTREEEMTAANLLKIYEVVGHVMGNFDNGTLKVSVYPVMACDPTFTDTRVYAGTTNRPSLNGGVGALAAGAPYGLTAGLLTSSGSTVIVVKAEYTFNPIILGYVFGNSTWTDSAILSPRQGNIRFDDTNGDGTLDSPSIEAYC